MLDNHMTFEPEPLPDSRWHAEQRAIAAENRAAEIREQEAQEACGIEEPVDEVCLYCGETETTCVCVQMTTPEIEEQD